MTSSLVPCTMYTGHFTSGAVAMPELSKNNPPFSVAKSCQAVSSEKMLLSTGPVRSGPHWETCLQEAWSSRRMLRGIWRATGLSANPPCPDQIYVAFRVRYMSQHLNLKWMDCPDGVGILEEPPSKVASSRRKGIQRISANDVLASLNLRFLPSGMKRKASSKNAFVPQPKSQQSDHGATFDSELGVKLGQKAHTWLAGNTQEKMLFKWENHRTAQFSSKPCLITQGQQRSPCSHCLEWSEWQQSMIFESRINVIQSLGCLHVAVSINLATASHHPFLDGMFLFINQRFFAVSPWKLPGIIPSATGSWGALEHHGSYRRAGRQMDGRPRADGATVEDDIAWDRDRRMRLVVVILCVIGNSRTLPFVHAHLCMCG